MSPTSARTSPGRLAALLAVALVMVVYCGLLQHLPARGVWVCDEGMKMISTQWIAATGQITTALPYPARSVDPTCRFLPFATAADRDAPLAVVTPRGPVSVFSVALPLVSAPFFRWFGWDGLYLVPLITACAAVWLMYVLWRAVSGSRKEAVVAAVLLGLLSPLWFYGVTFWEHAPALCAAAAGALCCVRSLRTGSSWYGVLGGLLFGIGACFREEMVLWTAASALGALLVMRDWRAAVTPLLGFALGASPMAAYNLASSGSLLGLHAATNLRPHLLPDPVAVYHLFISMAAAVPVSIALSAPSAIAVALALSRRRLRGLPPTLLALAGGLGVAAALIVFARGQADLVDLRYINSLAMFALFPIFASLSAAPGNGSPSAAHRWLLVSTLAYLVLCFLTASRGSVVGIHHGPRVLLPAFLFLSGAAGSGLLRLLRSPDHGPRSLRVAAVASLIIATLAVQLLFARDLLLKKQLSCALSDTVRAMPARYLVTSLWWAGAELAPTYYNTNILYSRSPEAELDLLDLLEQHGIRELCFLAPGRNPRIPLKFMDVALSPPVSTEQRRALLKAIISPARRQPWRPQPPLLSAP